MRDMTEHELAADRGMINGNLVPLASLLALECSDIHPIVQRRLLNLISGGIDDSDHRIFVEAHPGLPDRRKGKQFQLNMQSRDVCVAMEMADGADFIDDAWEWHRQKEAVASAVGAKKPYREKLGRASVMRIWAEQEPFIRFCIKLGSYIPRNLR